MERELTFFERCKRIFQSFDFRGNFLYNVRTPDLTEQSDGQEVANKNYVDSKTNIGGNTTLQQALDTLLNPETTWQEPKVRLYDIDASIAEQKQNGKIVMFGNTFNNPSFYFEHDSDDYEIINASVVFTYKEGTQLKPKQVMFRRYEVINEKQIKVFYPNVPVSLLEPNISEPLGAFIKVGKSYNYNDWLTQLSSEFVTITFNATFRSKPKQTKNGQIVSGQLLTKSYNVTEEVCERMVFFPAIPMCLTYEKNMSELHPSNVQYMDISAQRFIDLTAFASETNVNYQGLCVYFADSYEKDYNIGYKILEDRRVISEGLLHTLCSEENMPEQFWQGGASVNSTYNTKFADFGMIKTKSNIRIVFYPILP